MAEPRHLIGIDYETVAKGVQEALRGIGAVGRSTQQITENIAMMSTRLKELRGIRTRVLAPMVRFTEAWVEGTKYVFRVIMSLLGVMFYMQSMMRDLERQSYRVAEALDTLREGQEKLGEAIGEHLAPLIESQKAWSETLAQIIEAYPWIGKMVAGFLFFMDVMWRTIMPLFSLIIFLGLVARGFVNVGARLLFVRKQLEEYMMLTQRYNEAVKKQALLTSQASKEIASKTKEITKGQAKLSEFSDTVTDGGRELTRFQRITGRTTYRLRRFQRRVLPVMRSMKMLSIGIGMGALSFLFFGTAGEEVFNILERLGDILGETFYPLFDLTHGFLDWIEASLEKGIPALELMTAGFGGLIFAIGLTHWNIVFLLIGALGMLAGSYLIVKQEAQGLILALGSLAEAIVEIPGIVTGGVEGLNKFFLALLGVKQETKETSKEVKKETAGMMEGVKEKIKEGTPKVDEAIDTAGKTVFETWTSHLFSMVLETENYMKAIETVLRRTFTIAMPEIIFPPLPFFPPEEVRRIGGRGYPLPLPYYPGPLATGAGLAHYLEERTRVRREIPVTVNFYIQATIREEADLDKLSSELARRVREELRGV